MKCSIIFAAFIFLFVTTTSGAQESKIILRDYYLLIDGNTWTYRSKQFRADDSEETDGWSTIVFINRS